MFTEWWAGLSLLHQILYIIAIPSTIILILQTIMLLFGIGGNNDGDIDHDCDFDAGGLDLDGDGIPDSPADGGFVAHEHSYDQGADHDAGMRLFSVRGIVAFLVMGSWATIAALDLGANTFFACTIGFIIGLLSMVLIAVFFKMSLRLQDSGNLNVNNSIGATAEVYLTIPPSGKGKVTLIVQERFIEMDAVCSIKNDRPIKNGEYVIVNAVENNVLQVTPIAE